MVATGHGLIIPAITTTNNSHRGGMYKIEQKEDGYQMVKYEPEEKENSWNRC